MRLVYCGTGWLPVVDLIRERLPLGASIAVRDPSRPVREQLADADVILPSNVAIDDAALAAAPRLRLIQQPAAGVDGIDLHAARRRGIPVCNAPATNPVSVAETAALLMLACARRWRRAQRAFAAREVGAPLGTELAGKTLGVVGMGASGRALGRIARGLGMHVRGVTSTSPPAAWAALLADADVVSLHVPLTAATRGLFGSSMLARVKPGAILINCARGPVIDREALLVALDSGRLSAVGLDVHWREPWDPSDPLYARDEVVTLPHIGGSTAESLVRIASIVADNVGRLMRCDELRHRII
jgi:phosphoglycerate dehydrogenase-like enzyme